MTVEEIDTGIRKYLYRTFFLRWPDLDDMTQNVWVNALKTNAAKKAKHWGYYAAVVRSTVIDHYRRVNAQKRGRGFSHRPAHECANMIAVPFDEPDMVEVDDYDKGLPPPVPLIRANKIIALRNSGHQPGSVE